MSASRNATTILVIVSLVFFSLGMVTASIGPVLGELSTNTHTSLVIVGSIFTALFLGSLLTQLLSGFISGKVGLYSILLASTLLAALGMTGISLSRSFPVLLISAMFLGLGHGAANLSGNLSIAAAFQEKRVTAVNFVNIFYALGAFIGPALAGFSVIKFNTGLPVFWLGALLIFSTGLMTALSPQARADSAENSPTAPVTGTALLASPILWVIVLLAFFYGGSETGMAGWTTTFMQQSVSLSLDRAAFVTSAFYLALMLGRILCSWLGSKLSDLQILMSTLAVTFAGTLLFVAGHHDAVLSTLAVMIIGLGYGGTYPTMIAFSTSIFKHEVGKASSIIISAGSIGGMVLPPLQGVILAEAGPLPSSVMVAGMALIMLLASLISSQLFRSSRIAG